MESLDKNPKNENGMSITLPKFSDTEFSKSNNNSNNNTTSFGLIKFDIFDTDSTIISEFMSLSLNSKIEKFESNPSLRKLRDKNSSNTFLHYICMNDENYPMMEIMKPTKKEINKQNNLGQTSLHIAIINKNEKITKYLVENGADVNISDNNLNMSLHLAVMNNDVNTIMILLDNKANPLLVNKNNETVLDIAIKMDYKECIDLLKEISLMNETKSFDNKSEKTINLKPLINENIININLNEYKNHTINTHNNIFSPKRIHYNAKINNTITTPKRNHNISIFDKKISLYRKNIFLTSKKSKPRPRTNSTTTINFPHNGKIYIKKTVNRSQSYTITENEYHYNNQTNKAKKHKDDIKENIDINALQDQAPRKTDFIIQNEVFLESGNESVEEEEESVIRDNINNEKRLEKILESFTSLKTIKITPLTETKNKINPYLQIDSFVSALHKNDQGISESDGYIKDDGLIIVEPSIDITNNNSNNVNNIKPIQKKEKKEVKVINNNKEIRDTKEELYKFLEKIEMEQYIDLFTNAGYDDIKIVINQMKTGTPINDDILNEMGIERPGDRAKILIRIQECAHLFDFKIPFEAVYYINRKKFEYLKYDFHVKALQNWLKKLNLQKYLGNFYNNGYYSPELIFIQKASKFPINDTIIERDLKIENINDRKLIMSSISSNSKNYISELQKKNTKNKIENGISEQENEDKCNIF